VTEIPVRRLDPGLPAPAYARVGDAGLDLHAAHDVTLAPGARALVGTGIALAIPDGFAGFVLPRSGLALRHGVTLVNAPGLIDAGYRGEIKVLLINLDRATPVTLARGERVAQLVVQRVEHARLAEVAELPASERGAGGFGSTDIGGLDGPPKTPALGGAPAEPARPSTPKRHHSGGLDGPPKTPALGGAPAEPARPSTPKRHHSGGLDGPPKTPASP
jgi:dUTP pyrophosphatase